MNHTRNRHTKHSNAYKNSVIAKGKFMAIRGRAYFVRTISKKFKHPLTGKFVTYHVLQRVRIP